MPRRRRGEGSPGGLEPLADLTGALKRRRVREFLAHLKGSPFVTVVLGDEGLTVYSTATPTDLRYLAEVLEDLAS